MTRKPTWVKVLSGHAASLLVAGELEKRGILVNVLPERFEDFDLYITKYDARVTGRVQVKSIHSDRGNSIDFGEKVDNWHLAGKRDYVVAVLSGSIVHLDPPSYWIATKRDFARYTKRFHWRNRERRFALVPGTRFGGLKPKWKDNWKVFEEFQPPREQLIG